MCFYFETKENIALTIFGTRERERGFSESVDHHEQVLPLQSAGAAFSALSLTNL